MRSTPRGPGTKEDPLALRKSTARPPTADSATLEFHALAGHGGPADGCQDCAGQLQRQRHAAAALRDHQREARRQVDTILRKAAGS